MSSITTKKVWLTIEQAEKLNTKRLLAYYKKYGNSWKGKYICGCCHEFIWDIGDGDYHKDEFEKEEKYWSGIKEILNKRENV